jgi:hypothetical protein
MAGQYKISDTANSSSMSDSNSYPLWHSRQGTWVSQQGTNNWTSPAEANNAQARPSLSSMAPASLDEGGHGVIPLPESDYTLNHHRAQQHSLRGVPPPSQAPLIPMPDDGIALNPPSNIRGMKNKRWRPSDNQWNGHKNTIQRLYISENLSLDATMKFMGEHHTFWAS